MTLPGWYRPLQLLTEMPAELTGGLLSGTLLADVRRMYGEASDSAALRLLIIWAARIEPTNLLGELAELLYGSVPGADLELTVLSVQERYPADLVRGEIAAAHAIAAVIGYEDLAGIPDAKASVLLAEARVWLRQALLHPGPSRVTIAVHSVEPRRSDPDNRRDGIQQDLTGRVGLPTWWPAAAIVETGTGVAPPRPSGSGTEVLAERLTRPFRADLEQAHASATISRVRHALLYVEHQTIAIRDQVDKDRPTDSDGQRLRLIWLEALTAGTLAGFTRAEFDREHLASFVS